MVPVRLLIVGYGEGLDVVQARAHQVNRRRGRELVTVAGAMLDPRPAYDAADVVLGMGSSALKGMAFAKPLVVQGAAGYWRVLDEESRAGFLRDGWYGYGGAGQEELVRALRPLLADSGRREELGAFGRDLVVDRFSLTHSTEKLTSIYARTAAKHATWTTKVNSLSALCRELAKFKVSLARQRGGAIARRLTGRDPGVSAEVP